jgi:hypothetical protein
MGRSLQSRLLSLLAILVVSGCGGDNGGSGGHAGGAGTGSGGHAGSAGSGAGGLAGSAGGGSGGLAGSAGGAAGGLAGGAGGAAGGHAGSAGGGIGGQGGGAGKSETDGGTDAAVPLDLTAVVLDRRQTSFSLTWPAPATGTGGTVAGYDIRVAKVPITTGNFDDTAVTSTVAYTGVPAAPGKLDGMVVKNLNIEQGYYFAIVGKDSSGTRGTIMATAVAVEAQFLTTTLSGTGTDGIGQDLDGSGDFGTAGSLSFTADGFSDLIVGADGGNHVYIYFGTAAGYVSTPSITITGTVADFGQAVVNAGDLDGDGLADIAIASPNDGGGGTIYVFSRKNPPSSWGTTNSWPAALTDTQANYVLTVDGTFAGGIGSIQPVGMARLGNFDGAGSDDLAIGFALAKANAGSLLIVKGSSAFASGTIPGAGTIEIDGTAASGFLGLTTIGIGQFFPSPAGASLVTSAPGASAIYAFAGQAPTGVLTASAANDSTVTAAADFYGFDLGFLGSIGGPGAVSVAATSATPPFVDVNLGTAAMGPLLGASGSAPAPTVRLEDSSAGNSFGVVNLGGGIKGTSQGVSFIGGDTVPDLVVAGQSETGNPVYIVNGSALSAMSGIVDVAAAQAAVVPPIVKAANHFPSGWEGYGGMSLIVDSNKDGYADFAIGEFAPGKVGRVVVFY